MDPERAHPFAKKNAKGWGTALVVSLNFPWVQLQFLMSLTSRLRGTVHLRNDSKTSFILRWLPSGAFSEAALPQLWLISSQQSLVLG